jgi:pimeloyl-ACP methyl ester carboxylesterase
MMTQNHAGIWPLIRGLSLVAGLLLSGCSGDDEPASESRGALAGESFVLVHGAWNGDWVWTEMEERLVAQGAAVRSVTLPAHADDPTPVEDTSLEAYVDQVLSVVGDEPVTLVGHSFGGVVVSLTAEREPSRVRGVLYVGAFLPADGDTALGLAMTDAESDLGPALVFDMEKGLVGIQASEFPPLFCADCSAQDLKILSDNYSDEPLVPLTETIELSDARFGKVPKYYVFTGQDHVLSPSFQRRMADNWELTGTATLDTSHCPFFAAPDELTEAIVDLIGE